MIRGDGDVRQDAGRRSDVRARRRPFAAARRLAIATVAVAGIAAVIAPTAGAVLPTIATNAVTTPLGNFGSHRGVTVSGQCGPGLRLVGGGGYLRRAADPTVLPTNGLVLGGVAPSTGAQPFDVAVEDRAIDPTSWLAIANFTGVSEDGDQASAFALCASSHGPSHVFVRATSRTGLLATQEVAPPALSIATCPEGKTLLGGGATTSTPDQVNDGTTTGNNGNLKPMGSYPSDAAGVAAADGSTSATSWSAFGSSGISAATDTVTAYALCSSDPATPPVQVARTDVDGPDAQPGTTTITASATCPAATRMLGGGYSADETVAGTGSGLQPQQGLHMRGSYPSTPGTPPAAVSDATANPDTWSAIVQAGGQTLAAGKHMTMRAFALCATAGPPQLPPVVQTDDATVLTGTSASVPGTVTPSGIRTAFVFEYGTSLSFGAITTPDDAGTGLSPVSERATLGGLLAGRTYFYRLVATNDAGTTFGAVHSFTTLGSSPPVAQTNPATAVTSTSAILTGLLDPNGLQTAFTFEVFGPGGSVLTAIDNAGGGGGNLQPVSLPIGGLAPGTTYLYRLVATNSAGTGTGTISSFTTPASGGV